MTMNEMCTKTGSKSGTIKGLISQNLPEKMRLKVTS